MSLRHRHYFPHPFPSLFKSACQNLLLFRYPITLPSRQSSQKQQSEMEKLFSKTVGMYSTSLRQQPVVIAMISSFNNENRLLVLPTQMPFNFLLPCQNPHQLSSPTQPPVMKMSWQTQQFYSSSVEYTTSHIHKGVKRFLKTLACNDDSRI